MTLPSCKIFDVVVLLGTLTLTFCTVAGFIFEFYLTTRGLKVPDTLSRASAASLGALVVILTNAVQRRYHTEDAEKLSADQREKPPSP